MSAPEVVRRVNAALPPTTQACNFSHFFRIRFSGGWIRIRFSGGWIRIRCSWGWIRIQFSTGWIRIRFSGAWIRIRFSGGWIRIRFSRSLIRIRFYLEGQTRYNHATTLVDTVGNPHPVFFFLRVGKKFWRVGNRPLSFFFFKVPILHPFYCFTFL